MPRESWDELSPDKEAIRTLIVKHRREATRLRKLMKYYEGQHKILSEDRKTKLVCNHEKDIADTASSYFIGNSVSYKCKEDIVALADGTQKVIDLTRFVYSVDSTATVSMQIQDHTITARIVNGSVTMEKLDAAIQTEFRQYMLDAQSARDAALEYQKFAKRYTLGDPDFPGSENDCAKAFYEQAKADAATSGLNAQQAADSEAVSIAQAGIATTKAASATAAANQTAADVLTTTAKATAAGASEQVARDKAAQAGVSQTAASQSAAEALASALQAQRYTVGGVVPEDPEDNARWYWQQVQALKKQIDQVAKLSIPQFFVDPVKMKLKSTFLAKGMSFRLEAGKFIGKEIAT